MTAAPAPDFALIHKRLLPDSAILDFYQALIGSGRERASYPCLQERDPAGHLEGVRGGGPWCLVTWRGRPAGCVYLSDQEGRAARIHFALLPSPRGFERLAGLPFPVALGRFVLAATLHAKGPDGREFLDVLTGLTPAANLGAVSLIRRCGAAVLGQVPGLCFNYDEQANEAGVISYFTRKTTPAEWLNGQGGASGSTLNNTAPRAGQEA